MISWIQHFISLRI